MTTAKTTRREREAARARALLGDERLRAFFLAIKDDQSLVACQLMSRAIDEGKGFEELFCDHKAFGFTLAARSIQPDQFDIRFGCIAAEDAGDGGRWTVRYDTQGQIVEIEAHEFWVA